MVGWQELGLLVGVVTCIGGLIFAVGFGIGYVFGVARGATSRRDN